MVTIRYIRTVLLVLLLSVPGLAARAEDGLQRFEKEIKPQLQFKSFSYAKSAALGDKGFVLENLTVVAPGAGATGGNDVTITVEKVTVEEIDFDHLKDAKKDDIPLFARLKIEGVAGDESLNGMLQAFGVPKAPLDLALDYRLDPAAKVLTLSKFEVGLRGQASLTVSLVMEGVSDKSGEMMTGAKDNSRLRTASLQFSDTGLLAQLLPAVAKQQGSAPEALIAMVVAPLGAFGANQGPETVRALDAVASFAGDWKKPQGPIKISVTPATSASMADLDKINQPNALSSIFGLKVDYAGTRTGAAGGSASAPRDKQAAADPAGGDSTLKGAEAWMTIIGNTLSGKVDGDKVFEYYKKDGTAVSLDGSDITKGKWSLEGQKVCFKYPDEDKECYTVSRKGDEVTLMGTDGKTGTRLKLLPGNPKNL
jgi:hypothetical protein